MTVRETFKARCERFSRARRSLLNATLGYRLGIAAAAAGVAALLLLSGWLPNAFVNMALFLALALLLATLAVLYGMRRRPFRRHLDEAFEMERLAGNLNSRLISALDFIGRDNVTPLMQVTVDRAGADLAFDFEGRLDRAQRDRLRKRLAGLLALFLALGATPWFGFARLAANFNASLFEIRERLFPVVYEVSPPCGRYIKTLGEEVDVSLTFRKRGYTQATLVEKIGEETVRHALQVDGAGKAALRIRGTAEAEHDLHFEFGNRRSDHILLIFSDAPVLENMQTELVYPSYTQILPKTLEGIQERLLGLPGTKMTLGFNFSKDLTKATFTWDDGELLPLDVAGRFATTSIIHSRDRRATLQVEDVHGFQLKYPLDILFELQTDEKPAVVLPSTLKPEMPTLADGLKLFGFGVRLKDDFGVTKAVLRWTKSTLDNPMNITERGEVERLVLPVRPKAVVSFDKVFESLKVQPGDLITFKVEVLDNHYPQNQMTESPARAIFVYQQDLDALQIAALGFGSGQVSRSRLAKSKRATSVTAPAAMKTTEKVWNEYQADIATSTRAPLVPGRFAQAVKDYFRLVSTAVESQDKGKEKEPEKDVVPPPEEAAK